MATETERVTIRLPAERVSALEQLVKSGEFDTVSDAVRAAIDRFISEKTAPGHISKLSLDLPKGNMVQLQELVKSGDAVSVDDAVRNAVREYVRRRLQKALESAER
ncbi:MAG TPA: ribbon-helix-helix domain-containing protein [Thermoplasmata archaeon]|nr:ribbon-helix-helix domain-containing protein [Thermoplasmata archaeon]